MNILLRHVRVALACGGLLASLLLPRWVAAAKPDLVPEVFDISVGRSDVASGDVAEGCAGGTGNRLLLEYSLRSRNIGAGDLVMGSPMCPNCALNPGDACGNPLYICSPAHGHAHFDGFAQSVLLDAGGNVVATSHKSGFCLLDYECATPQYSCSFQGISAGCADVYERGLPCQYMDITDAGLTDGTYTLRVTMDPLDAIDEQNEDNNSVDVSVDIITGATACPRVAATDVPLQIPDDAAIASSVNVSVTGWVTRVRLQALQISHPSVGDLEVHLRSPVGTDVVVMDRVCGGSANVSLDLEDGADTAIQCPATDAQPHRPSNPVGRFVGEEANGTWVLTVYDRSSGQVGTLDGWALEVCTEPSCENPVTFTSSDVPKDIADLSTATSSITVPTGTGIVARAEVLGLQGLHTYVGDLEVELRSPTGRTLSLMNRECSAHHNFDLSLSSFAPTAIPCPPTDGLPHLPESSFTAFIGDLSEGTWDLIVHDSAPNDSGTLNAWGLRICPVVSTAATCPSSPASGCVATTRSRLTIENAADASDRRFKWKWYAGSTTLAQFGNPSSVSGYAACVYSNDVLVHSLAVASAGTCNGHLCWRSLANRGFRYRKRGSNKVGVEQLTLKAGDGSARIELRGRGPTLTTPLPLAANATVRTQLIRSDSITCWESEFLAPARESDALSFSDRTP